MGLIGVHIGPSIVSNSQAHITNGLFLRETHLTLDSTINGLDSSEAPPMAMAGKINNAIVYCIVLYCIAKGRLSNFFYSSAKHNCEAFRECCYPVLIKITQSLLLVSTNKV